MNDLRDWLSLVSFFWDLLLPFILWCISLLLSVNSCLSRPFPVGNFLTLTFFFICGLLILAFSTFLQGEIYWQHYPQFGRPVGFPSEILPCIQSLITFGLFLDANVEVPNILSSGFSSLGKVRPPDSHIYRPCGNDFAPCFNIMLLTSLRIILLCLYKSSATFISNLWEDFAHNFYIFIILT